MGSKAQEWSPAGIAMTRRDGPILRQRVSGEMKTAARTAFRIPKNRVIRKRFAAKTTGVHLCALPAGLRASVAAGRVSRDGYLRKGAIPARIWVTDGKGGGRMLSRDEVWGLADTAGEELEWELLSGKAGKLAAFFSSTGQGVYADYGRPTMDYAGFFRDYLSGGVGGAASALEGLQLGPVLIAADAAGASGLTALGHLARQADFTDAAVVKDVVSTGVYEGGAAWASAKIGVAAGARALCAVSAMPLPGARPASILVGFLVGAAAAIAAKRVTNGLKDAAVDTADDWMTPSRDGSRVGDPVDAA